MEKKENNETIVKHFYNLPPPTDTPKTENVRKVSLIKLMFTVELISSFENETIEYLSHKAIELLKQMKEEE